MSWGDIYKRLDAGSRFDLSGLNAVDIAEIFESSVSDEDIERVAEALGSQGESIAAKRQLVARAVEVLGSIAGIAISARKLI